MAEKRLTRGTATPADLRDALDELGIAEGEDFLVSNPPAERLFQQAQEPSPTNAYNQQEFS